MFAYCNCNPVNCTDFAGSLPILATRSPHLFLQYVDGCRGIQSTGEEDDSRDIADPSSGYALVEATEATTSGWIKNARIMSVETSQPSIDQEGTTLFSLDASVIAIDLYRENASLCFFDMGNASIYAGSTGLLPKVGAMVSLWSPSASYSFGERTVTLTLHAGAVGAELSLDPSKPKFGFAYGFGFTVSFS